MLTQHTDVPAWVFFPGGARCGVRGFCTQSAFSKPKSTPKEENNPPNRVLFLQGLPEECTEDMLCKLFEELSTLHEGWGCGMGVQDSSTTLDHHHLHHLFPQDVPTHPLTHMHVCTNTFSFFFLWTTGIPWLWGWLYFSSRKFSCVVSFLFSRRAYI